MVEHSNATYVVTDVGNSTVRHYWKGWGSKQEGTLCSHWAPVKRLRPSDGVYDLEVCRRCLKIKGKHE